MAAGSTAKEFPYGPYGIPSRAVGWVHAGTRLWVSDARTGVARAIVRGHGELADRYYFVNIQNACPAIGRARARLALGVKRFAVIRRQ